MQIDMVTLFPDMFKALTDFGVVGRAVKQQQIELRCWNPRDFTTDKHRTVDDRTYGGGPGMVMMVEPLRKAVQAARGGHREGVKTIYLSPQGRRFDQRAARELSACSGLIFVAGRYEGVDERFVELEVDEEWSIGDYVLSGGELAAMVMIDAIARFLPGVLGHELSVEQDSFSEGLLDCPHYTRPEDYEGLRVPQVLLSGDHARIAKWRHEQALERTRTRRPDLLVEAEQENRVGPLPEK